jgi:predicted nucleic acid-binding protein
MSELVYVDTNVYVSYFCQEEDYLRPISEFSFQFFRKVLKCDYDILISDLVLQELKKVVEPDKVAGFMHELNIREKIRKIVASISDKRQAHHNDRLHEILAGRGGGQSTL